MNIRNLNNGQAAENIGQSIQPDALIIDRKAGSRRPFLAPLIRVAGELLFNSAVAPSSDPACKPIT